MTQNNHDEVTRVAYTLNLAPPPISPGELQARKDKARPGGDVARIIRLVEDLQERLVIAEEKLDLERNHATDISRHLRLLAGDFARYARHREDCAFETTVYGECDCGFSKVSE